MLQRLMACKALRTEGVPMEFHQRCTIGVLILLVCLILGACRDKEPLKIGFVGGLSGRNGDLGTAGRDGAILTVDAINASGGINGRKIELVIRDDKSDPELGRLAVGDLLKAGVIAIVGPMTSALAEVTIPLADTARVAMFSPTVSSAAFNGKNDYFLHLNLNQDTASATADYMLKNLKVLRPAIIADSSNKAYSGTVAAVFKERFKSSGGGQVGEVLFNSKEKPDLFKIAQSVTAGKPDGFFVIAGALDSAMLCQQIRKTGSASPIFIAEWGGTNEFLKAGGGAVDGVRIFQHFNADSTSPAFAAFRKSYVNRFGDTPYFAATYSHEAVSIIAEALRKNGDRERIKETVIGIGHFKGLQGDITLDAFGDPLRSFSLMRVSGGRFTQVN